MKTPPSWLANGYVVLFACLPWSVEIDLGAWNLNLPEEPLLLVLGLGLMYLVLQSPRTLLHCLKESRMLQISAVLLAWMAISAWFSSIPLVSWKYWTVAAGHWWVFAVGISIWPVLWQRAFPWFVESFSGLALYVLGHHAVYHFRADQALLAPMPFFSEHTLWSATVVMVLFLSIHFLKMGIVEGAYSGFWQKKGGRVLLWSILLLALVLSNCRAAWLSVLLAGLAAIFLFLNRPLRVWLLLGLIAVFVSGLWMLPFPCRDVSSMERINRWACAYRMSLERPVFGFGPGTYQFQYHRFQEAAEMTRISLQQPILKRGPDNFGRGGGAHSEFFRALSESGWIGWMLYCGFVLASLWNGFKGLPVEGFTMKEMGGKAQKVLYWLALITFFSHGMVNDLWHDARIAALVWGSLACLMANSETAFLGKTPGLKNTAKQL